MVLVIDNYDSFVHNLARYLTLAGLECRIARNDELTVEEVGRLAPKAIVISPGPCTPREAGISVEVVRRMAGRIPILGVCLGQQCAVEAFGGQTVRSKEPLHGQATSITHDGVGLFRDLPSPMSVGRYHSLSSLVAEPGPLRVTARGPDGTVMGIQHESLPVYGVQFHPESILTEHGMDLVRNFAAIIGSRRANRTTAAPGESAR